MHCKLNLINVFVYDCWGWGGFVWSQYSERMKTPLLRCHPDRLTIESNNNAPSSRTPRACSAHQPRVRVALSVVSACSGMFVYFWRRGICFPSRVRRSRKGGWYGWKPSSSSICSIRVDRAVLWLSLDNNLYVERFEPTVSQSTVSSPPLL